MENDILFVKSYNTPRNNSKGLRVYAIKLMKGSSHSTYVLKALTTMPHQVNVEDIIKFCQPFFDIYDINYFDYARYYPDGTYHLFCVDYKYLKFFLDYQGLPTTGSYVPPPKILQPGKHLWQSYLGEQFLGEAGKVFNYSIGLTTIEQNVEFYELYNFSTSIINSKILDLYLNQDYILSTFVTCFKEQFSHVLSKKNNRLLTSVALFNESISKPEDNVFNKLAQILHLCGIKLRKDSVVVPISDGLMKLSKQEINCLSLLVKGKSAKEMAKILDISPKTVEIHTGKLLHKALCTNRVEMMTKLNKGLLEHLYSTNIL